MYAWGRGEHGRLGFGDNDKSSKMVPQKVNLLAGEDIIQVKQKKKQFLYSSPNFESSYHESLLLRSHVAELIQLL